MASDSEIAPSPDEEIAAAVPAALDDWSLDWPLILPAEARDTGYWLKCLVAAVLLHASVLGILNWPVSDNALGGGGTDLEAISVDVVQADALQAMAEAVAGATASMTAPLAEREGAERQQPTATEAPDRRQDSKPETAARAEIADLVIPNAEIKPEPPVPEQPSIIIAPVKAEQAVDAPAKPNETKAPPGTTVAIAASAPSAAEAAEDLGGARSQGQSAVETASPSAAVALTGDLAAYARLVQQAAARNPPKLQRGATSRGIAVITFALGLDGSLLVARVHSSSGNPALDDAALTAVRATRFPTPPAGTQLAQLIYRFPVKFR